MSKPFRFSKGRFVVVLVILLLLGMLVFGRLLYLDTFKKAFLVDQGDYESVHYQTLDAIRGMITDRNGVPLAVSAPLEDIVLDPKTLLNYPEGIHALANNAAISMPPETLMSLLNAHPNSRYFLLKKDLPPAVAQSIMDLGVPGVYRETHYTTYYPMGAPVAQLVGFTDTNNQGQDGLELALNTQLAATEGQAAVLRSATGNVVGILKIIKPAHSGDDVTLSIDSRLQFIAYQALQQEVTAVHADSGSVVILNPNTGEVLAAVSYPSFNPNDLSQRTYIGVKDRAITDLFEPGSTMKTFTIAAALLHGQYTTTTPVDTSPGWIDIGGHRVHDDHDNGLTDVTGVLKYSSNVGVAKIALSQPWSNTYDLMQSLGFGQLPGENFPAEASGVFPPLQHLSKLEFANMAFGYHISVSALQLARAYAVIANGGILYPITFLKQPTPPNGVRVLPENITAEMRTMMHTVIQTGGTGTLANIKGYEIAGKTGTTHIAGPHGYYKNKYNAVFAGIIPMNHPCLVVVIHITNPQGWINQFGGQSAAPVFANIVASAMRVGKICPYADLPVSAGITS